MNYDKDFISILKQSSFIDRNYLRAAKDGSEVFNVLLQRAPLQTTVQTYLLKNPTYCKASTVNYS